MNDNMAYMGIRPPSLDITFEAEKNNPDWSTRLSKGLKKELRVHFLSATTGKFKGILFAPKSMVKTIVKTLDVLVEENDIVSYSIHPPIHNTVSIKITARKAPVCTTVQENDFQILSPITVNATSKTYTIRGLIEPAAHEDFDKIIKKLTHDGISVQNISKKITFDKNSEAVLKYLPVTKNKRIIAKNTGLPLDRVERILDMFASRGILNLLELKANKKALNSEIHNVLDKEQKIFA